VILWTSIAVGLGVIITGDIFTTVSVYAMPRGAALWVYWAGVSANLGTTIFLAGVLVWFERQLTSSVERVEREAIAIRTESAALRTESEALRTATEGLETRLEQLDEEAARRHAEVLAADEQAFDALAEIPSRENVIEALARAMTLGAVDKVNRQVGTAEVTVPGGESVTSAPITFRYEAENANREEHLFLVFGREPRTATVEWDAGVRAAAAFENLRTEMASARDAGEAAESLLLEPMFANLQSLLEQATNRRRNRSASWLDGSPVAELLSPDLIITNLGIELRDRGVVIQWSQFGHWDDFPDVHYQGPSIPTRPDDIPADVWRHMIQRGRVHFEEDPDVDPRSQF
jgi:hypothetical protein